VVDLLFRIFEYCINESQNFMVYYIVAGILALFCIAVIIFVIKVYKENKKMVPKKRIRFDDDEDDHSFGLRS